MRTMSRQAFGNGLANAAAGAGDQRNLSAQIEQGFVIDIAHRAGPCPGIMRRSFQWAAPRRCAAAKQNSSIGPGNGEAANRSCCIGANY
jgi:hypothetical protein